MPPVEKGGPQLHGGKVGKRERDVGARKEGGVGKEERRKCWIPMASNTAQITLDLHGV